MTLEFEYRSVFDQKGCSALNGHIVDDVDILATRPPPDRAHGERASDLGDQRCAPRNGVAVGIGSSGGAAWCGEGDVGGAGRVGGGGVGDLGGGVL